MNVLQKLSNFEIYFHRSGMKTKNFEMTIICLIILFITWSFLFLNAIRISKVPEHYINRRIQYSTARNIVCSYFNGLNWTRMIYFKDNYLKLNILKNRKDVNKFIQIRYQFKILCFNYFLSFKT